MEKWGELKQSHKQLSAAAASSYDDLYANSNHATGMYMRYEEDLIKDAVQVVSDHKIAAVLGSGTGRESFMLAHYFEKVFGLDCARYAAGDFDQRAGHGHLRNRR